MPPACRRRSPTCCAAAAAEFEGDIAASTAGQLLQTLRDQVTPVCQQTVDQPLSVRPREQSGSPARRLSPSCSVRTASLDKFFTQYLAPYADTSKSDWAWRKESPVGTIAVARHAEAVPDVRPISAMRFSRLAATCRWCRSRSGRRVHPGPASTVKTEIGGTAIASPTTPGRRPRVDVRRQPQPPPPPPQSQSNRTDHRAMAGTIDRGRRFRSSNDTGAAIGARA